jgi:hypothetical protein
LSDAIHGRISSETGEAKEKRAEGEAAFGVAEEISLGRDALHYALPASTRLADMIQVPVV